MPMVYLVRKRERERIRREGDRLGRSVRRGEHAKRGERSAESGKSGGGKPVRQVRLPFT